MCAFVCLGVPGLGPSRGFQIPESGYQKNSFLVAGPQGTPDTVKYKVSGPTGAPDTIKYKMSGPQGGLDTVKQEIFGVPGALDIVKYEVSGPRAPAHTHIHTYTLNFRPSPYIQSLIDTRFM